MKYFEEFPLKDGQLCITSEYAPAGNLESLLKHKENLSIDEAMNYFTMILFALDFLHSKGIAHLDLKPSNIFISSLKDSSIIIKIGDFGGLKVDPE